MMTEEAVPRPCACTSVRSAARVLARAYDAALAAAGMNVTQLAVMRAILRHPHAPLSRVADDLAMDRTSLYRALSPMQRRGWVRLDDGTDGRSRSVSVTPGGHDALAEADPAWAGIQVAIVDCFGREQWQALAAELRRLAECAGAVGDGQVTLGEDA